MTATIAELNTPKEAFLECFQQWQHHWEKCVWSPKETTLRVIRFSALQVALPPSLLCLRYFSERPHIGMELSVSVERKYNVNGTAMLLSPFAIEEPEYGF